MPVHYPSDFPLDKASNRYYSYWQLIISKIKLFWYGIKFGRAVILEKNVDFKLTSGSVLEIGSHTTISSLTLFLLTKPDPKVSLGNHVWIGRGCLITIKKGLTIGDYTRLGAFVTIRDNIHEPFLNAKEKIIETKSIISPISIGQNVWIGNYATIMPGVTIGDGAVISMYSIVNRDVPAGAIVVGQPARILKEDRVG